MLLAVLGAAAGFFDCSLFFRSRILPGVTVGSAHVGGLTVAAARQRISDAVAEDRITVVANGVRWETTAAEIGYIPDVDAAVQAAFDVGRRREPFTPVVLRHAIAVPRHWSEAQLRFATIILQTKLGGARNATVVADGDRLAIIPEQEGFGINTETFKRGVEQALGGAGRATVRASVTAAQPNVRSSDLEPLVQEADALAQSRTVQVGTATLDLDRTTLLDLFTFTQRTDNPALVSSLGPVDLPRTMALGLQQDHLADVVDGINSRIMTVPVPKRVLTSRNNSIVLAEGSPGRELDRDAAIATLMDALLRPDTESIVLSAHDIPQSVIQESAPPAPSPTGKVIAVDLTKQTEYDYEDGALVYATRISSGINDWTPKGTFRVYAKSKSQKMSGPGYYLPHVPNILWFKGDYSLHGVYWHHDFGIRPRSHGCVGEPLDAAEWIFNWADVGTPVVIYKS